ncbi:MAG: phosphate-starvation-inducible PsiE family protein [Gallionella sp.]|nr:phosphate-starvation-inducible PsiE family protein [Gallionella sp.]
MSNGNFPEQLHVINRLTITAMLWLNGIAHIIIGLALAVSVLMFTWLFFIDMGQAINANNLVHGFLRSLGTLMLLWTVSALIVAEIRYLEGGKLGVDTFIEVALVVVLRKVITLPVLEVAPPMQDVLLWEGGALVLGVLYLVIRWAQRRENDMDNSIKSVQ